MTGKPFSKTRTITSERLISPLAGRRDLNDAAIAFKDAVRESITRPTLNVGLSVKALDVATGNETYKDTDGKKRTSKGSTPGMVELPNGYNYVPSQKWEEGKVLQLFPSIKSRKTAVKKPNFGWVDKSPSLTADEYARALAAKPKLRIRKYKVNKKTDEIIEESEQTLDPFSLNGEKTVNSSNYNEKRLPGKTIGQRGRSLIARAASAFGIIVDENGKFRCPPGTPAANQFTDSAGTNCFGISASEIFDFAKRMASGIDVSKETGVKNTTKKLFEFLSWLDNGGIPGLGRTVWRDQDGNRIRDIKKWREVRKTESGRVFVDGMIRAQDKLEQQDINIASLMDALGVIRTDEKRKTNDDVFEVFQKLRDSGAWTIDTSTRLSAEDIDKIVKARLAHVPGFLDLTPERQKNLIAADTERWYRTERALLEAALDSFIADPEHMRTIAKINFEVKSPDDPNMDEASTQGMTTPDTNRMMSIINVDIPEIMNNQEAMIPSLAPGERMRIDFVGGKTDSERATALTDFLVTVDGHSKQLAAMVEERAFARHIMKHEIAHTIQFQAFTREAERQIRTNGFINVLNSKGEMVRVDDVKSLNSAMVFSLMKEATDGIDLESLKSALSRADVVGFLAGDYPKTYFNDKDGAELWALEATAELWALRDLGLIYGDDIDAALEWMDDVSDGRYIDIRRRSDADGLRDIEARYYENLGPDPELTGNSIAEVKERLDLAHKKEMSQIEGWSEDSSTTNDDFIDALAGLEYNREAYNDAFDNLEAAGESKDSPAFKNLNRKIKENNAKIALIEKKWAERFSSEDKDRRRSDVKKMRESVREKMFSEGILRPEEMAARSRQEEIKNLKKQAEDMTEDEFVQKLADIEISLKEPGLSADDKSVLLEDKKMLRAIFKSKLEGSEDSKVWAKQRRELDTRIDEIVNPPRQQALKKTKKVKTDKAGASYAKKIQRDESLAMTKEQAVAVERLGDPSVTDIGNLVDPDGSVAAVKNINRRYRRAQRSAGDLSPESETAALEDQIEKVLIPAMEAMDESSIPDDLEIEAEIYFGVTPGGFKDTSTYFDSQGFITGRIITDESPHKPGESRDADGEVITRAGKEKTRVIVQVSKGDRGLFRTKETVLGDEGALVLPPGKMKIVDTRPDGTMVIRVQEQDNVVDVLDRVSSSIGEEGPGVSQHAKGTKKKIDRVANKYVAQRRENGLSSTPSRPKREVEIEDRNVEVKRQVISAGGSFGEPPSEDYIAEIGKVPLVQPAEADIKDFASMFEARTGEKYSRITQLNTEELLNYRASLYQALLDPDFRNRDDNPHDYSALIINVDKILSIRGEIVTNLPKPPGRDYPYIPGTMERAPYQASVVKAPLVHPAEADIKPDPVDPRTGRTYAKLKGKMTVDELLNRRAGAYQSLLDPDYANDRGGWQGTDRMTLRNVDEELVKRGENISSLPQPLEFDPNHKPGSKKKMPYKTSVSPASDPTTGNEVLGIPQTREQRKVVRATRANMTFEDVKRVLAGESPKEVMSDMSRDSLDPAVADVITRKSPEAIIKDIEDAAVEFHAGIDKRPRVRMTEGQLTKFADDGEFLPTGTDDIVLESGPIGRRLERRLNPRTRIRANEFRDKNAQARVAASAREEFIKLRESGAGGRALDGLDDETLKRDFGLERSSQQSVLSDNPIYITDSAERAIALLALGYEVEVPNKGERKMVKNAALQTEGELKSVASNEADELGLTGAEKSKYVKNFMETHDIDLCALYEKKKNVFCSENIGVKRENMPQSGGPTKSANSPAMRALKYGHVSGKYEPKSGLSEDDSKRYKDVSKKLGNPSKFADVSEEDKQWVFENTDWSRVEVSTEPELIEFLKSVLPGGENSIVRTSKKPDELYASQKQLRSMQIHGQTDGMYNEYMKSRESWGAPGSEEFNKNREEFLKNAWFQGAILTSRDGYVVDGHHRWAAIQMLNDHLPENEQIEVQVNEVQTSIFESLTLAKVFQEHMEIKGKTVGKVVPYEDGDTTPMSKEEFDAHIKYAQDNVKALAQKIKDDDLYPVSVKNLDEEVDGGSTGTRRMGQSGERNITSPKLSSGAKIYKKIERAETFQNEDELGVKRGKEISEKPGKLSSGAIRKTLKPGDLKKSPEKAFAKKEGIYGEERKSFDVYNIGGESVIFGGPREDFQMESTAEVKNVLINPYAITGLDKTSKEGQELSEKWIAARAAHLREGGSPGKSTDVDALLYASVRGDDDAAKEFDRLSNIGLKLIAEEKEKALAKISFSEDDLFQERKEGFDKIGIDDLYLVHETEYDPPLDDDGNIILKPLSAYELTSDSGEKVTVQRHTIHFALNHLAGGHIARQQKPGSNVIVVRLKDVLDNNPDSVDSLFTVDTVLTPKPGGGIKMPKGSFRVVKTTENDDSNDIVKTALTELGAKHFLEPGEFSSSPGAESAVRRIAKGEGFYYQMHSNMPHAFIEMNASGTEEQLGRPTTLELWPEELARMSKNAQKSVGISDKFTGTTNLMVDDGLMSGRRSVNPPTVPLAETNLTRNTERASKAQRRVDGLEKALAVLEQTGEWRGAEFGVILGRGEDEYGRTDYIGLDNFDADITPSNLTAAEVEERGLSDFKKEVKQKLSDSKKEVAFQEFLARTKKERIEQGILDVEDIPEEEYALLVEEGRELARLRQEGDREEFKLGDNREAAIHVGQSQLDGGVLNPSRTSTAGLGAGSAGDTGALNKTEIRKFNEKFEANEKKISTFEKIMSSVNSGETKFKPRDRQEADAINEVLGIPSQYGAKAGEEIDISSLPLRDGMGPLIEGGNRRLSEIKEQQSKASKLAARLKESQDFGYLSAYPASGGVSTQGYYGRNAAQDIPDDVAKFYTEAQNTARGVYSLAIDVRDDDFYSRWSDQLRGSAYLIIGDRDDTVVSSFGPSEERQLIGVNKPLFGVSSRLTYKRQPKDYDLAASALMARAIRLEREGLEINPAAVLAARRGKPLSDFDSSSGKLSSGARNKVKKRGGLVDRFLLENREVGEEARSLRIDTSSISEPTTIDRDEFFRVVGDVPGVSDTDELLATEKITSSRVSGLEMFRGTYRDEQGEKNRVFGKYVAPNGKEYSITQDSDGMEGVYYVYQGDKRLPESERVAKLTLKLNDGELNVHDIFNVDVNEEERKSGVAQAMVEVAKADFPDASFTTRRVLTADGANFARNLQSPRKSGTSGPESSSRLSSGARNKPTKTQRVAGITGSRATGRVLDAVLKRSGADEDTRERVKYGMNMAGALAAGGPAGFATAIAVDAARRAGREIAERGLEEAVQRGKITQNQMDVAMQAVDRVAPNGLPDPVVDKLADAWSIASEFIDERVVTDGNMQRLDEFGNAIRSEGSEFITNAGEVIDSARDKIGKKFKKIKKGKNNTESMGGEPDLGDLRTRFGSESMSLSNEYDDFGDAFSSGKRAGRSSDAFRDEYNSRIGISKSTPNSAKPVSGYVVHRSHNEEKKRQISASGKGNIGSDAIFEIGDNDLVGDGLTALGEIEVILKPEVSNRTSYGRGEALQSAHRPVAMNSNNPDDIADAIMNVDGISSKKQNTEAMLHLLGAKMDKNFSSVNASMDKNGKMAPVGAIDSSTRAHEPFEAQILGGFKKNEVEGIHYPYSKISKIAESEDISDVVNQNSMKSKLEKLGFTPEEIAYFYSMSGGKPINTASMTKLREYRAAKKIKEQYEGMGIGYVKFAHPQGINIENPRSYDKTANQNARVDEILKRNIDAEVEAELKKTLDSIRKSGKLDLMVD